MNKILKFRVLNLCIALIYLILLSKFLYWLGHYIFDYDIHLFEFIKIPYANTLSTIVLVGLVIFLESYSETFEESNSR